MSRAATLAEVMIVAALIVVLVATFAAPAYRSYAQSRAAPDAASTLAADLAFLERAAQNSSNNEGASLMVVSTNPVSYRGYLGRPKQIDPSATLGQVLVERTFPGVTINAGPIGPQTPLLFANNGSAQYESQGIIASQHQTIRFVLTATSSARTAVVQLNLFTGAVHIGS